MVEDDGLGRDLLRERLHVLRRRWMTIVVAFLLVVGTAVSTTLVATPIYTATAAVAVEPGSSLDEPAATTLAMLTQELETQRQVVVSDQVAARVVEDLALDWDPEDVQRSVQAELVPDTRVIEVTARHEDPQRAAGLANAVVEAYLQERRADLADRLTAAAAQLRATEASLEDRLASLERRLDGVDDDPIDSAAQASLQQQLGEVSAQLTTIGAIDVVVRGGGQALRAAQVPQRPSEPDPVAAIVLGSLVGLALGLVLAFARDRLDDGIRDAADATASADATVLGEVPEFAQDRGVVMLEETHGPAVEAFRGMQTNLRFVAGTSPFRSIVVTSPQPGDGKSIVAANLAVALAQGGRRVLLVDADLRRPMLHTLFGQPRGQGLSTVLTGEMAIEDVLVDVGERHLRLLPAGDSPPNPSGLLGSDGMNRLLKEAQGVADVVIIDAPPVLAVADPIELSGRAEATLLVVQRGATGRRALRTVATRIRRFGGNLVGLVVNRVPLQDLEYGYEYSYTDVPRRGRS